MSQKKDLTRIEDLGEFIHELQEDSELPPETDFLSEDDEFTSASESEADLDLSGELSFGSGDIGSSEEGEETSFETDTFADSPLEEDQSFLSTPEETTEFTTSDFESSFPEEEETTPLFGAPSPRETPEPTTTTYKAPENFEDLKTFSESSSFTGMATEGNPSFSVLVKNVRYIEDVQDILALLKELNLLGDQEQQTKERLMRGNLLVPRISEYAAIYLAHKLRRFDVDVQVGLSDEVHPPKHQERPEVGIVSKYNLFQNQAHHFHFDDPKLELSQIILAATPSLEGHQVLRYLGVASEHKMLESSIVEDESSDEVPLHYQELAQKLKAHALKAHANAVVGLNYQLTPIPSEFGIKGHKYRLTCTGNLVWVNKL